MKNRTVVDFTALWYTVVRKCGANMRLPKRLYIIHMEKSPSSEKTAELSKYLSKEKRRCVSDCFDETAKKATVYAHIAVKSIIGKEYRINAEDVTIVTDETGKPYVAEHPEIFFNISHTENLIAIAFSDIAVGVDAQTPISPEPKIAKRFFTQTEYDYIYAHREDTARRFTRIWTEKEAYIKRTGLGLRQPLNEFCVLDDDLKNKFTLFEKFGCIICFFDGESDNEIQVTEIDEESIENFTSVGETEIFR